MKKERVKFKEHKLERIYQDMLNRGIFDKLKKIDKELKKEGLD